MKTILKMALVCVLSLSFMTLSSCAKVNQKDLDEKIEKASENEGLADVSFTEDEYSFMAKYLLDRIDQYSNEKEVQTNEEEDNRSFNYLMILSLAHSNDKLKGDTKKDFESIQKKIQSEIDYNSMAPASSYDN